VIPREQGLSVAYLGGLLNSELLDLWYSVRGKTPWHVRRNYEPKRMKEIPYRHVDPTADCPKQRLKALAAALEKGDDERVAELVTEIVADLRAAGDVALSADATEAVEAGLTLETLVRAIADNRRALLPFRDRFPALARVVKDPWSSETVDPTPAGFVAGLAKKNRISVRVDPELSATIETDGVLGTPNYEHSLLTFAHRRKVVAQVDGPVPKLMLLAELLADRQKLMPAELLATEVPRDIEEFKAEVDGAQEDMARLLAQGRILVEAAERLVCALYGVPTELADEVVAHAVARAKAGMTNSA